MGTTTKPELLGAPFIAPLKHVERAVVVLVTPHGQPASPDRHWIAGTVIGAGYLPGIFVGEVVDLVDGHGHIVCGSGTSASIVATLPTIDSARQYAEHANADAA